MMRQRSIFVCLVALIQVIHGEALNGDEKLRQVCREKDFDQSGGNLIEPTNRTTCALFAEQGFYTPYRLKATERDGVIHLTGTVPGAGDYDGLLVSCGSNENAKCLRIDSSPGSTMNGAFMFYSNVEVNLGIHQGGPITYVASLDCKDGVPGQRYFEFRKTPSQDELDNIKTHYGIIVDSTKLSECLANKDKAFQV